MGPLMKKKIRKKREREKEEKKKEEKEERREKRKEKRKKTKFWGSEPRPLYYTWGPGPHGVNV